MSTTTIVGILAVEGAQQWGEDDRTERAGAHAYRPVGTPLRNDGIWRHWMADGNTYRITWDGTGWQVTCETWLSGHTYRLADGDAQFVRSLPLVDGIHELDPGKAYEIRETDPRGAWEVVAYSAE